MIENIAQVLQLGLSGVLAIAVVALWQETRQLRQEQRQDNERWQAILLDLLKQSRADREVIAQQVGATLPPKSKNHDEGYDVTRRKE